MFQVYGNVIQLYIYIYIFFFRLFFHYRLLQGIEYSPLCYTVGPCCLSTLYIVACICESQIADLSPPLSSLVTISLFSMSVSLFLFYK